MLYLRPLNFEDPRGYVEQVPESFGWVLNRRVYLRTAEDIDYVMGLVEKSYQDVL
jgi:predicted transport protein